MNDVKENSNVLVKSLGFSLLLVMIFTLVTNLLPQVEGEAPVEKEVDLGALTMESFAALGEDIFSGKGTCTLCHNAMGRAPDILYLNMVEAAAERLADSRYQGEASDAEAYLRESMVNPGIYVVAGFGKKGSNDTESPMPAVDKPPIELSAVEIDAVIAFLQSKDGNEVTVSLPTEAPPVAEEAAAGAAPTPAATAQEAIDKYGCSACHSFEGSDVLLGPPLAEVGSRLSGEEIRQSIIDPDAVIAEGFDGGMMPTDFADQMMVKELELLVTHLVGQ